MGRRGHKWVIFVPTIQIKIDSASLSEPSLYCTKIVMTVRSGKMVKPDKNINQKCF